MQVIHYLNIIELFLSALQGALATLSILFGSKSAISLHILSSYLNVSSNGPF